MESSISHQEEFIESWYQTAEYVLTDQTDQLSREEIDRLLAEATYDMTEEEAEGFLSGLVNVAKKGLKVVAPILKKAAPIIGTAAGAVIGGPIGAKLGGALGGAIAGSGGAGRQQASRNQPAPSLQGRQAPSPAFSSPSGNIAGTPAGYAPVGKQLLVLINNPEYLIQLLRAVIPAQSSRTPRTSESFISHVNTMKQLSEDLLDVSFEENNPISEYDDAYEAYHYDDEMYDDIEETHCECAH